MKKIFIGLLIGLGITLATIVYATNPFNSAQLAPNAVNGYCLSTNGSINNWTSNCGSGGSSATTTINGALGPNFTFNGSGITIATSSNTVSFTVQSSGSVTGGTTGYVTTWASSTGLTTGILLDNGTVAGVNATSSTVSFNVRGSGTLNPFNVASSSGTSEFQVLANGNVEDSQINNGSIMIGGASGLLTNSSLSQSAGTTLINGATPIIDGGGDWLNNVIQTSGANVIVQTATSTAVLGNLIQSGGVQYYQTTANLTPAQFCSGGLYNAASTVPITLTFPTLTQIGASPCGGSQPVASQFAAQYGVNTGSSTFTLAASGTGESFLYAPGSGANLYPGQTQFATGQFIATSTISGATTTGMSLNAYIADFQPTSTSPSTMGQILAADQTGHGWALTNLVAGSNVTITTSTPGSITIASSGSGSGNSAFLFGSGLIYNATSTDSVLIGTSTPTTAQFEIQGSGTKIPLVVASSSGTTILAVTSLGNVQIPAIKNTILATDANGNIIATTTSAGGGVTGSGTSTEITVWNSPTNVSGYSDFLWNDASTTLFFGGGSTSAAWTFGTNGDIAGNGTNDAGLISYIGNVNVFPDQVNFIKSYFQIFNDTTGNALAIGTDNLTTNGQTIIQVPNEAGTFALATAGVTGKCAQWSDANTLTAVSGACGPGGSNGQVQYNNSGSFSGAASLLENSSVVGVNATSSTVDFNIQGISGSTNVLFNVASSSTVSDFAINANGSAVFQPTATSTTAFLINNPSAQTVLSVDTNNYTATTTVNILNVASSTGATLFGVNGAGHFTTGGVTPVVSSCGTSPTLATGSTDESGTINVGSVSATACTLTFGTPFLNAPHCNITNQSMSVTNAMTYTESTTNFVVSMTGLTSDKLDYNCGGQ